MTDVSDDDSNPATWLVDARETALACIHAGIEAADPDRVVADALHVEDSTLTISPASDGAGEAIDLAAFDRVLVLGAGNAASRAASALANVLRDSLDGGLVVTDAPEPAASIEMRTADHPVPSERGVRATRDLLDLAHDADGDTLALVLVTGGGSALLPAPTRGVTLEDLQAVTDALLRSGAPIEDSNAVRKHLSDVKGGRLAAALAPARVVTLAISDVVGNPLSVVASGPTIPDPTTYQDAIAVLDRHDVDVPKAVRACLRTGDRGERPETPKPGDAAFDWTSVHVLADNYTACAAARAEAESRGYAAMVLTTRDTGRARVAARWNAAVAQELVATGNPLKPPAVVVTGGETTVRVTGEGRGGPNHEFALAAASDLPDGAVLGAVDTDGIDGNTDVAGALVDAGTVVDSAAADAALEANDSHRFLADRDALVEMGVTGTNVNDLRVLAVVPLPDN